MRYDEEKVIYRDCKFCGGAGCLGCKSEADKEYKRQFPDGAEPIATANVDDEEEMGKLRELLRHTLST